MLTHKINSPTFTGYDARRLRALCFSHTIGGAAKEISEIGQKAGFDVFVASNGKLQKPQNILKLCPLPDCHPWAQDIAVVTPENSVTASVCNHELASLMAEKFLGARTKAKLDYIVPSGGNLFFTRNAKDTMELLAGERVSITNPINKLKELFGVDKIHFIPQMDFHLDLFIRPLDNKLILVTDDNLTLDVLYRGKEKIKNYISNNKTGLFKRFKLKKLNDNLDKHITAFIKARFENPYKITNTDEVCNVLENAGYKTLRVPGRYYTVKEMPGGEKKLKHDLNYMNAIAVKGKDNRLYYITNKSLIDENLKLTPELIEDLDFSFEREFIKSLSEIISDKNIFFIRGNNDFIPKNLINYGGGIHCFASEVPFKID